MLAATARVCSSVTVVVLVGVVVDGQAGTRCDVCRGCVGLLRRVTYVEHGIADQLDVPFRAAPLTIHHNANEDDNSDELQRTTA